MHFSKWISADRFLGPVWRKKRGPDDFGPEVAPSGTKYVECGDRCRAGTGLVAFAHRTFGKAKLTQIPAQDHPRAAHGGRTTDGTGPVGR